MEYQGWQDVSCGYDSHGCVEPCPDLIVQKLRVICRSNNDDVTR